MTGSMKSPIDRRARRRSLHLREPGAGLLGADCEDDDLCWPLRTVEPPDGVPIRTHASSVVWLYPAGQGP